MRPNDDHTNAHTGKKVRAQRQPCLTNPGELTFQAWVFFFSGLRFIGPSNYYAFNNF